MTEFEKQRFNKLLYSSRNARVCFSNSEMYAGLLRKSFTGNNKYAVGYKGQWSPEFTEDQVRDIYGNVIQIKQEPEK